MYCIIYELHKQKGKQELGKKYFGNWKLYLFHNSLIQKMNWQEDGIWIQMVFLHQESVDANSVYTYNASLMSGNFLQSF